MNEPSSGAEAQTGGVDRRQLLLVSLCLVGLVVAAFLAPPPITPERPVETVEEPPPNDGGGDQVGDGGSDGGGGSTTGRTTEDDARGGTDGSGDSEVLDGDGEPAPVPGDDAPPTENGCGVVVEDRPVPGGTVTVSVYEDRVPFQGARVSFDDDPVGSTDRNGTVTGNVPYTRSLAVTVEAKALTDCEFFRRPYGVRRGLDADPDADAVDDANLLPEFEFQSVQQTTENSTGTYTVPGSVDVWVFGNRYPGTTVTVRAAIDGVPVRDATVTSNGEAVGSTDDDGEYQYTVPESQAVELTVSRGDFSGSDVVDVLLLEAVVDPQDGLPYPGEPAAMNATIDGRPTDNATMSVAGTQVEGTTENGVLAFELPADPTASVTVHTTYQEASVPLWRVYAPTVGLSVVLLGLALGRVAWTLRRRGRDAARRVSLRWAALCLAFGALVVWEARGLGVALAGVAAVWAYRNRTAVRSRGERTAGLFARVVRRCRAIVFRVTVELERLLDRVGVALRRLGGWAASLARSPGVLLARLRGFFDRVRTGFWLYLTVRRAGVALLALAELAAATRRWQVRGFVASLLGLACLGLLVVLLRRRGGEPGPVATGETTTATGAPDEAVDAESTVVSLRGLWRRFAQWVVPGTWRTRTPGEVSRAAIDRGFPRTPVEALTDAFRDVEYGSGTASTRRERARAAFDRLAAARNGEEDDQ